VPSCFLLNWACRRKEKRRNAACDFLQDFPSSASTPSVEGTKREDLPLEAEIPVIGKRPIRSFAIFRHAPKDITTPPTRSAMPSFPQFNPTRLRSYIFRLPLCTRALIVAIVGLYVATIPFPWLREFGQLEPAKMDFTQSMFPYSLVAWRRGSGELECMHGHIVRVSYFEEVGHPKLTRHISWTLEA
jgi:hypothetical protein